VPPRVASETEAGVLLAMPVHLTDVALAAKLVTVFPENDRRGIASHHALVALFDADTGVPLAVMAGGRITAARTAAAAAVAVDALARPDARILAILGAGVQGRSHLEAVPRVRPFDEIRIASRTAAHARALAERHPAARPADTFEAAVNGADVVCCCTDARAPIVRAAWLAPGVHVSAVGGTFGPELDDDTIRRGRVFVEWPGAVTHAPPAGAHELQGLDADTVTEIGEVLAGTRPGRQADDEVTVYKSTGYAVEDAAAGRLVYEGAVRAGVGTDLTL
jgi:ornithine cyclodeaminase/alanine dehydrogenase-like protein (mu-crystallin family)